MGTSYTVHVGPYLECSFSLVTRTRTLHTCTNEECEKHGYTLVSTYKFCPICGSIVGYYDVKYEGEPERLDFIYQEIEERLRQVLWGVEDRHYWIDNLIAVAPRKMTFDPPYDVSNEVYPVGDREEEKEWFADQFSDEIAILSNAYDSVSVEWGIIVDSY